MKVELVQVPRLKKDRLVDLRCCIGVFFLAVFFCGLLALAYPEGLVNEETDVYWLLHNNYHWFQGNQWDWWRTIPFGVVLGICTKFANPTNALYWFHSLIFSLNFVLVFILGRLLFVSRRAALSLAIFSIFFELVSMRVMYLNLAVSPDALMGQSTLFASLLVLIAAMSRNTWLFLPGYAIFGLVAFLKPMGVAIWPVWLLFALLSVRHQQIDFKKGFLIVGSSCLLMAGPLGLWCLHNYLLYGYAQSSAVGGSSFLQATIPLLTGNERLFTDNRTNIEFQLAVKECERNCNKWFVLPDEVANANLGRQFRYERYFLYGPSPVNPFEVIAHLTDPSWHGTGYHWIAEFKPVHMFKINNEAGRVAWRIVENHPIAYLQRVVREYVDMFSPFAVYTNPLYDYQLDPSIAYSFWDDPREGHRPRYPGLYAGKFFPDGATRSEEAVKLLAAIHSIPPLRWLMDVYYASQFWLSHLLFAGAGLLLIRRNLAFERFAGNVLHLRRLCVSVVMLFLTVALSFLMVASCQIARARYQITGEMELHAIFLLAAVGAACVLSYASDWLRSGGQAAEAKSSRGVPYFAVSMVRKLRSGVARTIRQMTITTRIDFSFSLLIFAASMFLGWLLSLGFPQVITTGETGTYYWRQSGFNWLAPNHNDWLRTIAFGVVLGFCFKLGSGNNGIYWLNTLMFSLSSALVYLLARRLFGSILSALILALTALLFEFVSMRTFFLNVQATADPFQGELVYLGVLLALNGWLYRRYVLIFIAFTLLGLAAFTKPIGACLFPLWMCFAAALIWREGRQNLKARTILLMSMVMLVSPVLLWSARNYCVYGYAKYTGVGGLSLLQSVLHLMSDKDQLFEDQRQNAEFIATVRECERTGFNAESFVGSAPWAVRMKRMEDYFVHSGNVRGPFDYLAGLNVVTDAKRKVLLHDAGRMFQLDEISNQIALRIVCAHPFDYLKKVLNEYVCSYIPSDAPAATWECIDADPSLPYRTYPGYDVNNDPHVYPSGHPDVSLSNRTVAASLGHFCNDPILKSIIGVYYNNQLFLCHLIFFGAIVLYVYGRFGMTNEALAPRVRELALVLILLFLTAAFQYLGIGLTTTARLRYSIGCGDLELHLLFLIALFETVSIVVLAARRLFEKSPEARTRFIVSGACLSTVVGLSIFLGWVLSLAYPQGITNGETPTYWFLQTYFSWFAPSPWDWFRTLPYGLVLQACSQFSNPTNAAYWLNTLIFSLNCGLIFILGRILFGSVKLAFALALAMLLFEFTSMHVFFHHLQVDADPFFAEIVCLGVLIALIAWLRLKPWLLLLAYTILGLAIFTKPAGISIVPLFTCFAIFFCFSLGNQRAKGCKIAMASVVILIMPFIILTTRNYCLYGYTKSMGSGGIALLQATLPLISPDDKLIDDPKENSAFVVIASTAIQQNKAIEDDTGAQPWMARNFQYKQFFMFGSRTIGPFDYLAGLKNPSEENRFQYMCDSAKMFALDRTSAQLGLRLIFAHPLGYLKRVFTEYTSLFCPLELQGNDWLCYQSLPELAYLVSSASTTDANKALYPGSGAPNTKLVNHQAAIVIAAICENPIVATLLNGYYASELWLSHLIFLVALAVCYYSWARDTKADWLTEDRRVAITVIVLFLTAASYYLVVGLVEIATPRYSVGGGDLELHLVFMIALFAVLRRLPTMSLWQAALISRRERARLSGHSSIGPFESTFER